MHSIRWGVIGLGFFGEKHAEVLAEMPGVTLTALCTRRPTRLQEVAERFNIKATYTNYQDLLADTSIDTISIVTHVKDHRTIACAALAAGKHVFLEKPMADTPEACDAILQAAAGAKGKFMVGHICRFDSRFALAKKAIDAGRLGRIVSMYARRNLPASIGAEVLDKISPLMGDGIHDTDLMLWLAGEPVQSVYARTVRVRDFVHPDIGWAMLTFAGGGIGVVETAWCLPKKTPFAIDARLEVIGTAGALYIDCGNTGLTIHDAEGVCNPATACWRDPHGHGLHSGGLRNEFEYFARCIRDEYDPIVITPHEARNAVAVMYAAEQSAQKAVPVKIQTA